MQLNTLVRYTCTLHPIGTIHVRLNNAVGMKRFVTRYTNIHTIAALTTVPQQLQRQ